MGKVEATCRDPPPLRLRGYFTLKGKILDRLIFGSWSADNKLPRQGRSGTVFVPKTSLGKRGIVLEGPTHPSCSCTCRVVSEVLFALRGPEVSWEWRRGGESKAWLLSDHKCWCETNTKSGK